MASSSIPKTTSFEIQTGDIRNPSKRASRRCLRGGGGPAGLIDYQFWCNGRGKKGRPLPWVIN